MIRLVLFPAIAALALTGCTRSVTTSTLQPGVLNAGVVYSLPKTLLKVSITYTIEKTTKMEDGIIKSSTEEAVIRKPLVVEPVLASDPQNCYVISGQGLTKDVGLDASFKFQINDNLLLAGVAADVTDKTPEILQGVVSSGLSIAKVVAMAGEEATSPLKEVAGRLASIDTEIATLARPNNDDPKRLEKLDTLQKEQQTWLSFVAKYRELNTTRIETRDVAYTRVMDLTEFKWAEDRWALASVKAPGKMLGNLADSGVPGVSVEVFANRTQYDNATGAFLTPEAGEKGVIYRVPTPLRTRITVAPSNTVFFDDYIPFAQVGSFNKVEASYKALAKRKTTMIFSATTGGLKEYGVETTSSAEAATKALDTSLSKVQTTMGEIKKTQDAAEAAKKTPEQMKLSELDMQKKLVDAETALLEAQQKLEKAKSAAGSK